MSDLDDVVAALREIQDAEWKKYLDVGTDDEYQHGVVDGVSAGLACVQAMIRRRKPPFAPEPSPGLPKEDT